MRGQVAFIAIIAVLIIIGVVGTIFIFSNPQPPPREPITGSELLSVQQCAERAFDESIALAGLYGGWVSVNHADIATFQMSGRDFALWSRPEHIPSSPQLRDQIASDLENRLSACTSGLEGPRTASIDVQIGPTSRAAIEIDAWIALDSAEQRLSPFVVESRLPILQALNTAESFVKTMWDDEILTDLNFELISINPDVPLEGVEFSCTPKRWSVSEVSEAFFRTVEDAMAHVSFDGTPMTSHERLQRALTFDANLPNDVSLSAYYFTDFGGDLSVERSSGDIMSSYVVGDPASGLCQNTYQFWYSMNYPVVFTLTMESDDDFLFRFAVPVSVQRNQEREARSTGDVTFCSDVTPRTFTLSVVDAKDGSPLDDVRATYVCDSYRCPLESVAGGIEDHLPARCLSATITLDKEGYAQKRIDYRYDQPLSGTTVELEPLVRAHVSLTCEDEPCSFNDVLLARIDGRSYPLRIGESFLPSMPDSVLVLERVVGSSPQLQYTLEPFGDEVSITINTEYYRSPADYSIEAIFGNRVGDAS
ncbi:MAG: hypothetical protein ACMXYM_04385 [Candidatus Woesearchaeota archaeon]